MQKVFTTDELPALIGSEIGVSDWLEVTQESINTFADVTRDQQFIHVDPQKAADTPFGGTIAHGFYTLSMLSYFAENGCGIMLEGAKMGVNYGCDKLRFINPVRVGSQIRGRSTLLDIDKKSPEQYLFRQQFTVELRNAEKPALSAQWLTMVFL